MNSTSHNNPTKHHQKSSSELLSSAKYVVEAAKHTMHHESDEVDKGRVAGAAADLLGAASEYGKLEEKSFGKYVGKAEKHQYHSSHSTTTTTHSGHSSTATPHSSFASSDGHGKSGSGYGDYLKMAEGFLKKH